MTTHENHEHDSNGESEHPKIVKEFGAYRRTRIEHGGVTRETVEEKRTRVIETTRPPEPGGRV